jgi:YHS domain-containing protein
MNRKWSISLTAALLALSFSSTADEKKAEPKKQTHCPVMQRYPVDHTLYIDIKGKRIYVCCKGCINQIKANPDKYIKRLEDKGVIIEKPPTKETPRKKG